jgi:glycosyltransferase involved in cell wall biosynthesis
VLIDASHLSSVGSGSGVGTYVDGLLHGFGGGQELGVRVRALATANVTLPAGIEGQVIHRSLNIRARVEVMEQAARLPVDVWKHRLPGEVFHNPGFHAPWGMRRPWVQTLLDVIPLVVDDPDQQVLRQRWKHFGPRYRKADAVIAISSHAADEGVRVLGIDPDRVHVAHLGVNSIYRPTNDPPADPPYLLAVSEYSRRKGFAEAFGVMDALVEAGYPHTLKVAGRVQPWARQALYDLRASSAHPQRIEILGFVEDLAALYRGAAAFLMTSRYEGFGLTALEAMASGVPVIAFSNSAVTEVVDTGGQLVADGDVEAMMKAVRTILDNRGAAADWQGRGLDRASQFSWNKCAQAHAEVYRLVSEGHG